MQSLSFQNSAIFVIIKFLKQKMQISAFVVITETNDLDLENIFKNAISDV